jgi:hypothetical protein
MNRVTFKLRDTGIKGVRGLAFVEDGFLVLKMRSAIIGFIGRQRDTVKIEPKVLESITIKRGPRKHSLVLKPKGVELLDALPGKHISTVRLKVKRKQRKVLKALAEEIRQLQQ